MPDSSKCKTDCAAGVERRIAAYSGFDSLSSTSSPSTEIRRERRKFTSFFVKCAASGFRGSIRVLSLLRDFVQTDGGLEHQEHVETMLADVLDHAGDLLALNNGFMDCLSELLDQFAQA